MPLSTLCEPGNHHGGSGNLITGREGGRAVLGLEHYREEALRGGRGPCSQQPGKVMEARGSSQAVDRKANSCPLETRLPSGAQGRWEPLSLRFPL